MPRRLAASAALLAAWSAGAEAHGPVEPYTDWSTGQGYFLAPSSTSDKIRLTLTPERRRQSEERPWGFGRAPPISLSRDQVERVAGIVSKIAYVAIGLHPWLAALHELATQDETLERREASPRLTREPHGAASALMGVAFAALVALIMAMAHVRERARRRPQTPRGVVHVVPMKAAKMQAELPRAADEAAEVKARSEPHAARRKAPPAGAGAGLLLSEEAQEGRESADQEPPRQEPGQLGRLHGEVEQAEKPRKPTPRPPALVEPAEETESVAGTAGGGLEVTAANADVGIRVQRGMDWKIAYGDEDGGPGGEGVISDCLGDVCEVVWDSGSKKTYRMGKQGKFELALAASGAPEDAPRKEKQQCEEESEIITPLTPPPKSRIARTPSDFVRSHTEGNTPPPLAEARRCNSEGLFRFTTEPWKDPAQPSPLHGSGLNERGDGWVGQLGSPGYVRMRTEEMEGVGRMQGA